MNVGYTSAMPDGLKRYQQTGDLHFVTFSCVRHRPILGSAEARNTLCRILEETRVRYRFHVLGYVVMPDHVHLLTTEPELCQLSTSIQIVKQRFSRTRQEEYVWESRYLRLQRLHRGQAHRKAAYIHPNPVKRGLVAEPDEWAWSSYNFDAHNRPGAVTITPA